MRWLTIRLLILGVMLGTGALALAQIGSDDKSPFSIVGQFDRSAETKPATVTAQFTAATAERSAVLMITAKIFPGWHAYAITQPPGGPQKTKIDIPPTNEYRLLGGFSAIPEPKKHVDQTEWVGLELQEHEGEVTWYAPIELSPGVDPKTVQIRGTISMQVCKEQCVPVREAIVAKLGEGVPIGPLPAIAAQPAPALPAGPTTEGTFQAADSEVKVSGKLVPGAAKPGGSLQVQITTTVPNDWRIYANAVRDDSMGPKPTIIVLDKTSGLIAHRPFTDAPVKIDNSVNIFGPIRYHEGTVTWITSIDVPANLAPGDYPISGLVGYQACEYRVDGEDNCELAHAARFQATVHVSADGTGPASVPLVFSPVTYRDAAVAAAAWADANGYPPSPGATGAATNDPRGAPTVSASNQYDLDRLQIDSAGGSLAYYLALAFVGGIILNLMPCVLPVIGLKVMSFVQQAGHSRAHALVLNIWYSAGIVAVFVLLGLLAAVFGLTWGGQFGSTAFNATIAAVVFAMALSLLGVWEVPIPGFFGSGAAQDLAAKEGPMGAFTKGAITTVLATPCTAPFMATAIAWAVAQPIATTLAVFTSLGLGMASPYLVVGVYPELLRFLPKPGSWMETFKQLMGFVLLATVVFILSFMQPAAVIPTLGLLLGVGVACWLIARTPLTSELNDRLQSWAMAGAVTLLFGVVSFGFLYSANSRVTWQPFSLEKLQRIAVNEGRTVIVDFSAEWCITCKALERAVLHTKPVEQAIAKSGAVTMYADFTDYPPEIERTIHALKSNGVPVIAVFPGDAPYEPIVFRGGYTQQGLIDALNRAKGKPSPDSGPAVAEANANASPLN